MRRPQEVHGRPRAALRRPYCARMVALWYVAHPACLARPTHGSRTPAARHLYGPRGSLRRAWNGYIYSRCVAVASVWSHGRHMVPPAATLRLPWYLSKTYGRRRDALRRPCVITSKAVRQQQVSTNSNTLCGNPNTQYTYSTVCDRGNAAAAL